ncbi:hypothetical protein J22TS1_10360 [Siminovitchia terrae]|nr:hypothetical protein J22TS1_10360 [Siminovitchia terrae]
MIYITLDGKLYSNDDVTCPTPGAIAARVKPRGSLFRKNVLLRHSLFKEALHDAIEMSIFAVVA